jgi:hypothetical protein
MDCVLVVAGRVHEVWPNTAKSSLSTRFTADLLSSIAEVSPGAAKPGDFQVSAGFHRPYDSRTERVNGAQVIAKTPAEVQAYDETHPFNVPGRAWFRRWTDPEKLVLLNSDAPEVKLLLAEIWCGATVNVYDSRVSVALRDVVSPLMLSAGVWASDSVALARIADLTQGHPTA